MLNSAGLVVEGNRCEGNRQGGMFLLTNDASIKANTASRNLGDGIHLSADSVLADGTTGTTGNGNVIDGNTAEGNMGDGFVLSVGSNNTFTGNKASANGDDGLDLESDESLDTLVDGNNFSSNGHEGLDNGAANTDVTNNTCRKNGHGFGPDIAGTGSFALGSVDAFENNKFDTGGESAVALMDNYGNTVP
jgi:parallel beta-helix repeat protein